MPLDLVGRWEILNLRRHHCLKIVPRVSFLHKYPHSCILFDFLSQFWMLEYQFERSCQSIQKSNLPLGWGFQDLLDIGETSRFWIHCRFQCSSAWLTVHHVQSSQSDFCWGPPIPILSSIPQHLNDTVCFEVISSSEKGILPIQGKKFPSIKESQSSGKFLKQSHG